MPTLADVLFGTLAIVTLRAGTIVAKFGLAVVVGRYLDLAALGFYGLAAGAIAIGPVVISAGMVHLIMRDAVTLSINQLTNHLRHYWGFTIAVYAVALTLTGTAALVFGASSLWVLIILIMLFEHIGSDVFQLLSNLEQPMLANVGVFLRSAAWILIYIPIAIWLPAFRSITILFEFWLGGSLAACLLFLWISRAWPWRQALARPLEIGWIGRTMRRAAIIYLSDLSFIVSQYLDRYLVTLFLGLRLAGIYFLYWSAANAVSTFVSIAVLQIQRPRLIKAFHDGGFARHRKLGRHYLKTTTLATAIFGVTIGCAFLALLPFLKQPAVMDHLVAFWLIMAGMAMRNIADFGAMALFTSHRDRMMTASNVAAILLLAAAQIVLLPTLGLYGVGAAILLTFAAMAVWRYWLVFRPSTQPAA